MKSVTVRDKDLSDVLDIVHELKKHGWVMGVDFDWTYIRPKVTYDSQSGDYIRCGWAATFDFYKEEYGTYFALRWA